MREPDRYLKWFKSESVKQIYRLGIWNVCENEGKLSFPSDGEVIQLKLYWTSRGYLQFTTL